MSQPSAPPPYEDRNPLYPGPPPPGGYGQPTVLPGGYPAYPQPGYGHPAGYPQPMPPIHPPMSYGPGHGYGGEERAVSDNFGSGEWSDRKVRHAFIRKVYAIISVQLLITVAIIAIFTFVKPVSNFVRANLAVYYASYAVFLATYLTLICCQGPRRRFPWNIILLTLFTLAMGFMTGTISSVYDTKAVILAMIITAVVSISVTIFCFQTKVDFTSCTGLFCVLGIVMMVTGIVTAIVLFTGCTWSMLPWVPFASLCSWLTTRSWSWGTGSTPSAPRTTSPAPCRSTPTSSTSSPLCCSSWGAGIKERLLLCPLPRAFPATESWTWGWGWPSDFFPSSQVIAHFPFSPGMGRLSGYGCVGTWWGCRNWGLTPALGGLTGTGPKVCLLPLPTKSLTAGVRVGRDEKS
uniref:Transmembrane BAX inhibitor motif containing 1 n=1 Tax=Sus scrofa TaxID=9823 RepID=A0A8D1EKC1_PIG